MKKSPVKTKPDRALLNVVNVCGMCTAVTRAAVGQANVMNAEPAPAKELLELERLARRIGNMLRKDTTTTRRATLIALIVNANAIVQVVEDDNRQGIIHELRKRIAAIPLKVTKMKETPTHIGFSVLPGKKAKR